MIDLSTPSDVSSMLAAYLNEVNGCFNCTRCNDVRKWILVLQVEEHMDGSAYSQYLSRGLAQHSCKYNTKLFLNPDLIPCDGELQ